MSKLAYIVTGPGDNHTEDMCEIYSDERAALLRALDWGGDDMAEAELHSTEDLWNRLEWLIEQTGEIIRVDEHDLDSGVEDEPENPVPFDPETVGTLVE